MRKLLPLLLALVIIPAQADRNSLMPEPNSVFLRVIDTGSGTATLTIVTGDTNRSKKVMFYDVGHWNDDNIIIDEIRHYLGWRKKVIDLVIVGHSDSDHLGAADTVFKYWKVKTSVRTGYTRTKATYKAFRRELKKSVEEKGTKDFVIEDGDPALGEVWSLGAAKLTFLSGFKDLPSGWNVGLSFSSDPDSRYQSKVRNAISVVVRLDFAGKSILFPGDAVGRKDDTPQNAEPIGTEKFLLDNNGTRPIDADIVMAPHHGADNASSKKFVEAVSPEIVIFSAGSQHKHPKFNTFRRYRDFGVPTILRTDVGDEKGRPSEWWGDWHDSCRDGHGDDGISILIRQSGEIVFDQDPVADASKRC